MHVFVFPFASLNQHTQTLTFFPTQVFVSSMNRERECQPSSLNLLFSDDGKESVLSYAGIPADGEFRPASSLMETFSGMPVNGDWRLAIAQSQPTRFEEYHGKLMHWELLIDTKPCFAKAKWDQLPMPPSTFKPRRLHSAVAVDNSIFIAGGFAERRLNDLWRFDYEFNSWTQLNSAVLQHSWPLNEQVALLSPFGVLGYGGIATHGTKHEGYDMWLADVFEDEWSSIHVPHNSSAREQSTFK